MARGKCATILGSYNTRRIAPIVVMRVVVVAVVVPQEGDSCSHHQGGGERIVVIRVTPNVIWHATDLQSRRGLKV
eukprot:scaffold196776_cov32-Tisochrysis_lutea.AAC.3